jgi:hypothetical protein
MTRRRRDSDRRPAHLTTMNFPMTMNRGMIGAALAVTVAALASLPRPGWSQAAPDPGKAARIAELDTYWAKVSRAVNEGDFESYRATCHPEGVLVSGSKGISQPLADALARWKQEFLDTRAGKLEASVEFRFARRLGDATTAHESGIFLYRSRPAGGEAKQEYVHFDALLVKRQDGWKILMEHQKGPATEAEWQALE